MNLEKEIIRELKSVLNNQKFKGSDLMEWSSSKKTVEKNINPEIENYASCQYAGMTWHCAVLKTADKREPQNE